MRVIVMLVVAAVLVPLALAVGATAPAAADPYARLREAWVPAPGGVGHIKVRTWLAANGSDRTVYLLDGLRAPEDLSDWEHQTNAAWLSDHGVNVVEPVGGTASFYSDWYFPNNFTNQPYTYTWETFLTRNLPDFLAANYGLSRSRNAVVGLSMGGNAALILASRHRDQFAFAGALSGYLNLSAPGMREAIRVAMLDAGLYNSDCMWGPPWDPAWLRHDPFVQAEGLRGLPMWVAAGSGLPGEHTRPASPVDYWNTTVGMGLEALSLAQTRAFQVRLLTMGVDSAHFEFPNTGIHAWPYWQDQLWAMLPMMKAAIGA